MVSMQGRTALVFGVANKRSIAWAIALKLQQAGYRLAIVYQNERLEQEARDLIADLPGAAGFMCDLSSDEQIAKLFDELRAKYGVLHGVVHSVAFAPAEELKGEFVNTTREGFRICLLYTSYWGRNQDLAGFSGQFETHKLLRGAAQQRRGPQRGYHGLDGATARLGQSAVSGHPRPLSLIHI